MPTEHLSPAQPAYVLRGHTSQVHALSFAHNNSRLFTGDADGWVVSWSLAYKRPTAVWRPHSSTVLGFSVWGTDRVITHGRDSKLLIWKLAITDEENLDKILPVDNTQENCKKPEIIHALTVNTLNFCSFAWCPDDHDSTFPQVLSKQTGAPYPILISVPSALDSEGIDIFKLPSEKRTSTIPADKTVKTGMVMALAIHSTNSKLRLIAGYESGHTIVYGQSLPENKWQKLYSAQPHSQPILSLAPSPSFDYYLTSSADAIIAKHPLLSADTAVNPESKPLKLSNTKHAGQQGLSIRSDGKIYATAGWDARVHVYSAKTMKELAVLKWHKEGCYATAFAEIDAPAAHSLEAAGPYQSNDGSEQIQAVNSSTNEPLPGTTLTTVPAPSSTVSQRRDLKAQTTHWLAAGSKDGKVSLWDIY
ncbi:ASTRA complex subunit [Xylographa soralifera]|nr:ASTRA complex subunit [Xylographa soralifera]